MPFFSIIIPTFNSEKYISRSFASLMNQTFKDYEIIVQDGISSDATLSHIENIKVANPSVQLKVFTEKDQGVFDAMNKAIMRSDGEWILFLGSDDELYDQDVLQSCFKHLQHAREKMIYGNVMLFDAPVWANGSLIYDGPFTVEKLLTKNICHQAIFYNRNIFNEIGYYNTRYQVCADWDFNLRCFAKSKVRYIDEIISKFSGGGLSSTSSDNFSDEMIFILKEYFNVSYFNKLFESYSGEFLNQAFSAYKGRRFRKSLYYFFISFMHAKPKTFHLKIIWKKLIGQ